MPKAKPTARRRSKRTGFWRRYLRRYALLLIVTVPLATWALLSIAFWPGFFPHTIEIVGARIVPPAQIRAAAHIDMHRSIWLLNPWTLQERIERIPYVNTAHLQRTLPNKVTIVIDERRSEACLIDPHGRALTIDATQRVLELGCHASLFFHLPQEPALRPGATVNDGEVGNMRSAVLALRRAGLVPRDCSIVRGEGLVVIFSDGLSVLFGDDTGIEEHTTLLRAILHAAEQHGHHVAWIDMRIAETPVLRYREENATFSTHAQGFSHAMKKR